MQIVLLHDPYDKHKKSRIQCCLFKEHPQKNRINCCSFERVCVQAYACMFVVRFYEFVGFLLNWLYSFIQSWKLNYCSAFFDTSLFVLFVSKGANMFHRMKIPERIPVRERERETFILWCNSNYAGFWKFPRTSNYLLRNAVIKFGACLLWKLYCVFFSACALSLASHHSYTTLLIKILHGEVK